jgi:hypothetical protein
MIQLPTQAKPVRRTNLNVAMMKNGIAPSDIACDLCRIACNQLSGVAKELCLIACNETVC